MKLSEYKADIDPIFLNAVQMFFGGFLLYITGVAIEGYHNFIGKPLPFYLSLGTLVFVSVFAFSFWFMALQDKNTKVSEVNMCRLINPILGAVLSWIMLPDEKPTFNTVAGMIIIVFSLIFYFRGKEYFENKEKNN
ncbi:MAG: DMT family transporter [Fusobacterium sp.]